MSQYLIEGYNPFENAVVTEKKVLKWRAQILEILNSGEKIKISSVINKIFGIYAIGQYHRLRYSSSTYNDALDQLNNMASEFMAFQEALYNLMIHGGIMPIFPNYGDNVVHIQFEENGNLSQTQILVPKLPYETFIRKPSLKGTPLTE